MGRLGGLGALPGLGMGLGREGGTLPSPGVCRLVGGGAYKNSLFSVRGVKIAKSQGSGGRLGFPSPSDVLGTCGDIH